MVPVLDLTRQYKRIKNEILSATERIYEKGHFILGEEVSAFEEEFSHYCGVRYGVGVGSGTRALYLVSYPYSLSEGFSGMRYRRRDLSVTHQWPRRILSLPFFPEIKKHERWRK